jgi:hypothetical protein
MRRKYIVSTFATTQKRKGRVISPALEYDVLGWYKGDATLNEYDTRHLSKSLPLASAGSHSFVCCRSRPVRTTEPKPAWTDKTVIPSNAANCDSGSKGTPRGELNRQGDLSTPGIRHEERG